ncbi:MAG: MFS transporter [Acidimicrobiales bacterium]
MREVMRNSAVRRILAAAAVSQVGDWAARLAIAFVVLDETGLASGVGVAGALFFLPWLGPGQYLAAFGDQMDRVRLLFGCELSRAVLYGLVALGAGRAPVWVLLGMIAVVAVIDPVWESNRSALIVDVTSEAEYPDAVKVIHTANQTATLIGWGVGGLLVASLGAGGTLGVNALTFLASAFLIGGVSTSGQTLRTKRSGSFAAARAYLTRDRLSATALGVAALLTVAGMAIETQAPVFGRAVGLSEGWIGIMIAMIPLLTLITVVFIPTKPGDRQLLSIGFGAAALAGAGAVAAFAAGGADLVSFLGYGGVGIAFGASMVANIVFGRRLPDTERAAIFSVVQGAIFISLSAGSLIGGLVSDIVGIREANVIFAIAITCVAGLGAVLSLRHVERDSRKSIQGNLPTEFG